MSNHVKIVIVNDTDFGFGATGEESDFVMTTGTLSPGSNLPPPFLKPKEKCDFTVMTPLGDPGPEGYLRYDFEILRIRVWINWADTTKLKPGAVTEEEGEKVVEGVASPFTLQWTHLASDVGEVDPQPVALTDERGKPVTLEQLANFHQLDATEQAQKDKYGNLPDAFRVVVATFTLRVKNAQANASPPALTPAVMPAGVVRPTGGSKAVVGAAYHTWDAPGLSQKRKKLLAVIGNLYPQLWVPLDQKVVGSSPYRPVPYQRMVCWSPGKGTSCTSFNGMVEGILTGSKVAKWAFAAYHFEEAFVPWGANPAKPMPNVGDVYILYRDVVGKDPNDIYDNPHERHCGFIVHVPEKPGEDWITADGGQKDGKTEAAFLNRRPWEMREPSQPTDEKKRRWDKSMFAHTFARPIQATKYPYLGGGAESKGDLSDANRLIGWLDIDSPSIQFHPSESFDPTDDKIPQKFKQPNHYTDYDYQFLGAWIDDLLDKRPGALAPWLEHLKKPKESPPPWKPRESTEASS